MQIRKRTEMTREEALMLLEATELECENLQGQLAEARRTIERREAVIKILEADIEAIGAGGVSAQRITGSKP